MLILVGIGVRSCLNLPAKLASRAVGGVGEGISEIFVDLLHVRPEIREGTKVTWGQTSARTEVIVAEKKIEVEYDWEHVWLGSHKVIRLTQAYRVKAGFDLGKSFWIELGPGLSEATAHLPPAEILAVSPEGSVSYLDEDGWWNKVTDQDREGALQKLAEEARLQANRSGLLGEAEEMTGSRLTDLARAKDIRLQLDYRKP
ncbi:MAG: DUF4230 domain-containing protein [Verrucomicrobia bacterium]|nr:DUF4230 domain-containing protein [Verrucomicrobiota bacterium]